MFLQRERIRVEIKRTVAEHTNWLGIIVRPVVDRANLGQYEKAIILLAKFDIGDVEFKKDYVYEGGEQQWCIVVLGIWSQKEKVELVMRRVKLGENSHIKYVSFAQSTRNECI